MWPVSCPIILLMRRYLIFGIIVLFSSFLLSAQNFKQNPRYLEYIEMYKDIAVDQMKEYGIPASITIAQGIIESGAGQSELAQRANNHFGIKCGSDWTGPTSYHDDDERGECFRVYDSALESFRDHSEFLKKKRYSRLFELKITDYKGWAHGLKAAGYATSPIYAKNLINIIETYELYRLDNNTYQSCSIHSLSSPLKQRTIYLNNENYYIKVRHGDTFRSLGKELNISWRKLARYNERDKRDVLKEGEVIYLKKKKSKAEKKYKKVPHIVQNGESMYSIAQRYGIRLKKLYKMNDLEPNYKIHVGDRLRVR